MQVGAIIVSPTRELARQTYGVMQPFVQSVPGLQAMLLVGGTCVACPFRTQASLHSHITAPLCRPPQSFPARAFATPLPELSA